MIPRLREREEVLLFAVSLPKEVSGVGDCRLLPGLVPACSSGIWNWMEGSGSSVAVAVEVGVVVGTVAVALGDGDGVYVCALVAVGIFV